MTIASISVVYFREHLISFGSLSVHLLWDSWRRILHVGLPSAASTAIGPLTMAFITSQVAQFGQEAVAGYGVASRVESLITLVLMALSVAVTPFVGQNYGARKPDRVNNGIRWSWRFSLGYGLCVALILALSGSVIASAFTDNQTAIDTASLHLRIVPISYLALGVAMTATSSFNAIGKPMPGLFISMTRTILVYAPLAFLFARLFGLTGIFAAACAGNFVAGTCGFLLSQKVFLRQGQVETQAG
jgi:Na+-driven multidrug efflux pump